MILDKLLERKDLEIYIDMRIKRLLSMKVTIFPQKQRGKIAERIKGRVAELRELKKVIKQAKLKDMSKLYWRKAAENGEKIE